MKRKIYGCNRHKLVIGLRKILISHKVELYLKKRNLWDQFLKAKKNLYDGNILGGTRFKKREPKEDELRYFRINKQYRAIGEFDQEDNFIIMAIDDHQ